jgi:peptidylprolyl isomerase
MRFRVISTALAAWLFAAPALAQPAPTAADWRTPKADDVLVIDTNKGRILVEMTPETAPLYATRMRELTREGLFNGLTFFRVIDDFMAQTGDPRYRQFVQTGFAGRVSVPARAGNAIRTGRGPERG